MVENIVGIGLMVRDMAMGNFITLKKEFGKKEYG